MILIEALYELYNGRQTLLYDKIIDTLVCSVHLEDKLTTILRINRKIFYKNYFVHYYYKMIKH